MTDISNPETLREAQQKICQKYGSPIVFPAEMSKMGIAIQTLNRMPIYAARLHPENGTNGWYIYGGVHSDSDDFYQPLHVSHLFEVLHQVLPYLALAPGYRFIIDNEGYEDVWYDPAALTIR